MEVSRRHILSTGAAAVAATCIPGRLLAAVEAATPPPPRLDDWAQVKKQFALSPEWLHFAGFFIASHPQPVREAIEGFRRAIDENPFLAVHEGLFDDPAKNLHSRAVAEAAAYLGGKPEEVALTRSTTEGLALVYHGLPLGRGDEVLTTRHDHRAHHDAIRIASLRSGASTRKIALFDDSATATAGSIVERLRAAVRPATRVIGITWVHSQSGIRLPIRQIASMVADLNRARDSKDHLLLIVDGVHGLGCVDETVATMGADYFCAGTHKWIFGPRGTGIVWARPDRWARLREVMPTFTDREMFGAWTEDRAPGTPNNARRMTPGGFQAFEHQWALAAAFRFSQSLGRARVAARVRELNQRIKKGLAALQRVKLHTPMDPELSAGICCFDVEGRKPDEVVAALLTRKVIASTSPYAVSCARLSAGICNTPDEVDRAVEAVRGALA